MVSAKGHSLFLGVGVVGAFSGVKRRSVWFALWLPALALAGAPLTSGMVVPIRGLGQHLAGAAWRFRAMPTGDGQLSAGHLTFPCIPPGDLLLPISRGIAPAVTHGCRLAEVQLPRWRDALLSTLRRPLSNVDRWRIIGRIEDRLNHWSTALVILVLLGLIVTALGMRE